MILLVDNYDSFTYNLMDYVRRRHPQVIAVRNDNPLLNRTDPGKIKGVLISPGPGTPAQAGKTLEVIQNCIGRIPVLGVCLGHQAIAEAFGGKIVRAKIPMHGKTSVIRHDGQALFRGLKNPLRVMRYHSLVVREDSLPPGFLVTARSESGEIMGIRHTSLPVEGVQFHPEAALTENGEKIIRNWVNSVIRRKSSFALRNTLWVREKV